MTLNNTVDTTKRLHVRQLVRQGSIRRKLLVFVAALVILTTLALTVGGYLFVHQLLLEKMRHRLTLEATNRWEMLQTYIQQQHERVALVASRTRLRQLLQQYLEGTLPLAPFQEQSRRILHDARESTSGFLAIWITDSQGQVVIATHQDYLHWHDAYDTECPKLLGDVRDAITQGIGLHCDERSTH